MNQITDPDFQKLLDLAKNLAVQKVLNKYCTAGQVACALMTTSGNIYTGISLKAQCSLGSCAETAAALEMLKAGETKVAKIVAYSHHDCVYSMCGRCREYLRQIDEDNMGAEVLVSSNGEIKTLKELLPYPYISQREV